MRSRVAVVEATSDERDANTSKLILADLASAMTASVDYSFDVRFAPKWLMEACADVASDCSNVHAS